MKFKIDAAILEKFPDLNIGVVVVKGVNNTGSNEEVMKLIREKEQSIRSNPDILSQDPKIAAWRKAYSSFGAKKYRCSVENLYRMILAGIELRHINKIVDIYNLVSIKHMIPIGGDNTDKINGNITLKLAQGDETFIELNSQETKNPKEGEVIYVDDSEVLCRRWNWRECDKSKMTEETRNVALVVEGIPPVTKEEVEAITKELNELVLKHCSGESEIFLLNSSNLEVEIN